MCQPGGCEGERRVRREVGEPRRGWPLLLAWRRWPGRGRMVRRKWPVRAPAASAEASLCGHWAPKGPAGWHLCIFQIKLNLSAFVSWKRQGLLENQGWTLPLRGAQTHILSCSRAALAWQTAELTFPEVQFGDLPVLGYRSGDQVC